MRRSERILRPMSLLDILDGMFDLYKSNLATLIGIVAIVYVPIQTAGIIARRTIGTHSQIESFIVEMANMVFVVIAGFIVMAPLMLAISEAYLGRKITIVGAYRRMMSRLLPFAGTYALWLLALLSPVVVGGGVIAVIFAIVLRSPQDTALMIGAMIVGLLIYCAMILAVIAISVPLAFACPTFVAEDKRYVSALRRSWSLVRGHYWRTLGILLLTGLIVITVESAVTTPLLFITGAWKDLLMGQKMVTNGTSFMLYGIGDMIISTAIEPIWLIATVLLYYDLRIRKEGYDLQVLAAEMGYREPQRTEQIAPPAAAGEALAEPGSGATE